MDLIKKFMKIGGFQTPGDLEAYGEDRFFNDFPEARQYAMGGTPKAFPQIATADNFFNYGVPPGPQYLAHGGSAFPQAQTEQQFFIPTYTDVYNPYNKAMGGSKKSKYQPGGATLSERENEAANKAYGRMIDGIPTDGYDEFLTAYDKEFRTPYLSSVANAKGMAEGAHTFTYANGVSDPGSYANWVNNQLGRQAVMPLQKPFEGPYDLVGRTPNWQTLPDQMDISEPYVNSGIDYSTLKPSNPKNYMSTGEDILKMGGSNVEMYPNAKTTPHWGPSNVWFQDGGQQQQQDPQALVQQIAQALEKGMKPQQIAAELMKTGMPQDKAMQAVQMVMQEMQQMAMQQQAPQQEPMPEQMPEQPMMEKGGNTDGKISTTGEKRLKYLTNTVKNVAEIAVQDKLTKNVTQQFRAGGLVKYQGDDPNQGSQTPSYLTKDQMPDILSEWWKGVNDSKNQQSNPNQGGMIHDPAMAAAVRASLQQGTFPLYGPGYNYYPQTYPQAYPQPQYDMRGLMPDLYAYNMSNSFPGASRKTKVSIDGQRAGKFYSNMDLIEAMYPEAYGRGNFEDLMKNDPNYKNRADAFGLSYFQEPSSRIGKIFGKNKYTFNASIPLSMDDMPSVKDPGPKPAASSTTPGAPAAASTPGAAPSAPAPGSPASPGAAPGQPAAPSAAAKSSVGPGMLAKELATPDYSTTPQEFYPTWTNPINKFIPQTPGSVSPNNIINTYSGNTTGDLPGNEVPPPGAQPPVAPTMPPMPVGADSVHQKFLLDESSSQVYRNENKSYNTQQPTPNDPQFNNGSFDPMDWRSQVISGQPNGSADPSKKQYGPDAASVFLGKDTNSPEFKSFLDQAIGDPNKKSDPKEKIDLQARRDKKTAEAVQKQKILKSYDGVPDPLKDIAVDHLFNSGYDPRVALAVAAGAIDWKDRTKYYTQKDPKNAQALDNMWNDPKTKALINQQYNDDPQAFTESVSAYRDMTNQRTNPIDRYMNLYDPKTKKRDISLIQAPGLQYPAWKSRTQGTQDYIDKKYFDPNQGYVAPQFFQKYGGLPKAQFGDRPFSNSPILSADVNSNQQVEVQGTSSFPDYNWNSGSSNPTFQDMVDIGKYEKPIEMDLESEPLSKKFRVDLKEGKNWGSNFDFNKVQAGVTGATDLFSGDGFQTRRMDMTDPAVLAERRKEAMNPSQTLSKGLQAPNSNEMYGPFGQRSIELKDNYTRKGAQMASGGNVKQNDVVYWDENTIREFIANGGQVEYLD